MEKDNDDPHSPGWWQRFVTWRIERKIKLFDERFHAHRERCRLCILDDDCEVMDWIVEQQVYWKQRKEEHQR